MLGSYLITLIPLTIGAILWAKHREVHWIEWAGSSAIGLLLCFIFNLVAIFGMTTDKEIWSGQVKVATHHPRWHASWWETQSYSCGTSKHPRTCTRLVHRTRNYPERWSATVSYGEESETYNITKAQFDFIRSQFGVAKPVAKRGYRPHMDSGDPYDYHAENLSGAIVPGHTQYRFENRVKAAPSLFSYPKVPENQGFPYPYASDNWMKSNRLVGTAKDDFSIEEWDILNAKLGPTHFVNLIAVGFGDADPSASRTLEAKWVGGKKNDLVICYGGNKDGKPSWTYVFGWTEEEIVKKNLQTLFLLNTPNDSLIPAIYDEVAKNYKVKNWTKFDYITVEPPTWSYFVLLLVMGIAQFFFWMWSLNNDVDKEEPFTYRYRRNVKSLSRRVTTLEKRNRRYRMD
jgi:hypothetical protein